jgi:hemin uptake protein HemP
MNLQSPHDASHEPAIQDGKVQPEKSASPALSSDSLLQGQKAVTISHNGSVYRLQTTRQGKLILTK